MKHLVNSAQDYQVFTGETLGPAQDALFTCETLGSAQDALFTGETLGSAQDARLPVNTW